MGVSNLGDCGVTGSSNKVCLLVSQAPSQRRRASLWLVAASSTRSPSNAHQQICRDITSLIARAWNFRTLESSLLSVKTRSWAPNYRRHLLWPHMQLRQNHLGHVSPPSRPTGWSGPSLCILKRGLKAQSLNNSHLGSRRHKDNVGRPRIC